MPCGYSSELQIIGQGLPSSDACKHPYLEQLLGTSSRMPRGTTPAPHRLALRVSPLLQRSTVNSADIGRTHGAVKVASCCSRGFSPSPPEREQSKTERYTEAKLRVHGALVRPRCEIRAQWLVGKKHANLRQEGRQV